MRGGQHSVRSVLVLEDTFSADSSASYSDVGTPTASISGGEMTVINSGATASQRRRSFTTVVGVTYRVEVMFRRVVGTAVARVRNAALVTIGEVTSASATNELKAFTFVAGSTTSHIDLGNGLATAAHESRFDSFKITQG